MTCPCEKRINRKVCKTGTPPVIEVHSEECPVLFHTVNIPASAGNIDTVPPTPGAYRNARVFYEADNVAYLYDSDGIPQLLSTAGADLVTSVNGKTGNVVLDAEDVNAQPKLTAGTNITIDQDNVISAEGTTYTAGANISIDSDNVISATNTTYSAGTNISIDSDNVISATDTTYTAGTNISIDSDNVISATSYTAGANVSIDADHVISATDTTYSNFVGTDGQDAGSAGLVPAPATTDAGKFLKADGTWDSAGGGTLYTTTGQNEDGAMTQKATTDMVFTGGDLTKINIGNNGATGGSNSVIIGHNSAAASDGSVSIGTNAKSSGTSVRIGFAQTAYAQYPTGDNSISLGYNTRAIGTYSVAIGNVAETGLNYSNCVAIGSNSKALRNNSVAIGNNATSPGNSQVAIGDYASNQQPNNYSVALGYYAGYWSYSYTAPWSVALGAYSLPRAQGVVDVSTDASTSSTKYGYQGTNDSTRTPYRVISGVHDGEQLHDVATVAQGNTLSTSAPTTSTVGVLGQLYTDTTNMHTYQLGSIDTTDPSNPVYNWVQRW